MKFKRLISILLAFAVGVLIAFYFSQPEVKRKMTSKAPTLDIPLAKIVPATKPVEEAKKPMSDAAQKKSYKEKVQEQSKKAKGLAKAEIIETAPAAPPKKLNLSLPQDWDKSDQVKLNENRYPNFFKPAEAKKFNVSTKLLWDESEEARELPLEKMLEGAELELQFKLP